MKQLFTIILLSFTIIYSKAAILNVPGTYLTIQAGLNAASNGDIVLVQPGTYIENITWPTTQGITLLSDGNSTNTIIDGNTTNRVITFPTGQNYTNTTVIDGFTIQNGYITGTFSRGAGIYAKDCSAYFKNLIIRDNLLDLASSAWGGGIYADNSPNIIIDSCTFLYNEIKSSAYLYGAAIYCTNNTSATITNSVFLKNKATRTATNAPRCYGGVIYANNGCDLTITNVGIDSTTIEVNSYIYGGAIYLNSNESTLTNVEIGTTSTASNSGRVYGGGIYYINGDLVTASPTWNNITISGQDILATSYIYGGALYLQSTSITINNAFFTRSVCNNSGGRVYGGGVYLNEGVVNFSKVFMTCNQTLVATSSYNYGAGFYIDDATVTLTNALIAHNEATNANTTVSRTAGLGIFMSYTGTLTAINVTVTENTRVGALASYGTGLANFGGTVNLTNSILWNDDTGNEIQGGGTNNINYSDVRGGYAGTGNINSLPQFVTLGSDYHLQATSPCIDVGTAAGAPITDLDNSPRPVGSGYDMGSFESQPYTNIDFCPIVILPIKLLSFDATCDNGLPLISWVTSSEINNDYFVLEKSSDGENFHELIIKQGAGNSNSIVSYSVIDDNINNGDTYYRLKQVDFNGEYSYSSTIVGKCSSNNFNIYPNPASSTLNIDWQNTNNQDVDVVITNSIGQVVIEKKISQVSTSINIENLSKGLYQIQIIEINNIRSTLKFIKQ